MNSVAVSAFWVGVLRFLKAIRSMLRSGTLQPGRTCNYKEFGSVAVANRLLLNQMLPGRCGRVGSITKSCDSPGAYASGVMAATVRTSDSRMSITIHIAS